MKYCPYCGAALPDGAVSFCPECGENLPNMTEEREKKHEQSATDPDTATENRKAAPKKVKQKRKQKEPQEQDTESYSAQDDGYDGYYDDVLPADAGRLNEGHGTGQEDLRSNGRHAFDHHAVRRGNVFALSAVNRIREWCNMGKYQTRSDAT